MIHNDTTTSNLLVPASGNFTLEANAYVFKMLSANVYNDTILAGIRELSTNAVDAGLLIGSTDPFDVQLPTVANPTFAVRDFGPGLSELDLTTLYTTMGASTKRDSNAYNGCFGIGKLAPLAYTSSFTVESFHAGTHYSYLISTKDGIPCYLKLSESPSSEPSGLRISYAIDARDISKFVDKATFLYTFFSTRPTTNIELDYPQPSLSGANWALYPSIQGTYVVMANVPYRISSTISRCAISIPTGSVSITPGRESLTYDSVTETYIDNLITATKADIRSTALAQAQQLPTPFEQLLALTAANQSIYGLNLKPSDAGLQHLVTSYFQLTSTSSILPMDLSRYSSKLVENYYVSASRDPLTHIFIQDVPSNFLTLAQTAHKAVDTKGTQLILRPSSNTKTAITQLLTDYPDYLANLGLSHLPIVLLSTYVTETVKATSTKLTQTVFQPTDIYGCKLPVIDLSTDTSTYYYFLEPPADTTLYNHIESLLQFKFLVLPKKVHSIISNYPTFIPVSNSVLQSLFDPLSFTVVDPDIDRLSDLCYYIKDVHSQFFNFKSLFTYARKCPTCHQCTIDYIHSHSSIRVPTTTYSHPVTTSHILSVYPELGSTFQSCYNTKHLDTYISLKDQIHALHSASGLPSPIVPPTSDYPSSSSLLPSPQSQPISS